MASSIPEETWIFLSHCLETDNHPGSKYLKENFSLIKETIGNNPTGRELVVYSPAEQSRWVALAGVTMACHILHLHFVYVIPEERGGTAISVLLSKITKYAKSNYYGFVSILCPDGFGLKYAHDLFGEIAASAIAEETPFGSPVVKYMIPKAEWENVFEAD